MHSTCLVTKTSSPRSVPELPHGGKNGHPHFRDLVSKADVS